jgi:hypothetical protein
LFDEDSYTEQKRGFFVSRSGEGGRKPRGRPEVREDAAGSLKTEQWEDAIRFTSPFGVRGDDVRNR